MPSTDEELKKALKAFKKRLKMTQLDDDSKLGHSPLTGNHTHVLAIQPPMQPALKPPAPSSRC